MLMPIKPIILSLLLTATLFTARAAITLPRLVRDSMVLQREAPVKIWGWATPGEKVSIQFNGRQLNTRTAADGKWQVKLPPMKAGGPYTMQLKGNNRIQLNDIWIGDVWVCAGQSNMVHQLQLHEETYTADIAAAQFPQIRQFWVPTLTNLQQPQEQLPAGYWKTANPQDVKQFSAVAYFFALSLHRQYKVPIGIINTSVGGTPIEAWTSEEGLKAFPNITATIQQNKDTAYVNNRNRLAAAEATANRPARETDPGLTGPLPWYHADYTPKNWRTINIPGSWEDQGTRHFNGTIWYRREIEVSAAMAAQPAKLYLGRIVDADFVYINGRLAGSTSYQYPQRRYALPVGILKAGKNTITIRVISQSGKGGFVPDKPYCIKAGNEIIDLKGNWQYKVGDVYNNAPPRNTLLSAQNQPTALFNAMVSPVINYAIKGIAWYQGESNAGNPGNYEALLKSFIADWRHQWQQGDIPFVYAQLPNFMEVNYLPAESGWAQLREAQLHALQVPNTGMAVTMGLGEWNDIHPDNKKDVGLRLALAARHIAYNENLVYSGPLLRNAAVTGNTITLSFDHTGSGLTTSDGDAPGAFAIAGADKKFVWAQAAIVNNTVVVSSPKVPQPVYVRYAWADNPDQPNLCNREGLPASPFRTDQ